MHLFLHAADAVIVHDQVLLDVPLVLEFIIRGQLLGRLPPLYLGIPQLFVEQFAQIEEHLDGREVLIGIEVAKLDLVFLGQ